MPTNHKSVPEIEQWIKADLAGVLGVPEGSLATRVRFKDLGLDSATVTAFMGRLSRWVECPLSVATAWARPTISELAAHVGSTERVLAVAARGESQRAAANEPIAVVGIGCRFPGQSNSAAEFWSMLRAGRHGIREVPSERWDLARYFSEDSSAPGKMNTRWGGFIDGVDRFDAAFFGMSPREAMSVDPQQRLALELTWEALEDAGVLPAELRGSDTSVYFGAMWTDYGRIVGANSELIDAHTAPGQDLSLIAGRISYFLGAQGPSMVINTACSSSLVALHQACLSIRTGESSIALVGGVNLILSPLSTVAMSKFGAMAPDGRCKAFDAAANGYVRGEGGAVVVLKPLSKAILDGDRIYCLVHGSAINNDGASNGLTAPSPQAQEAAIRGACHNAGVDPSRVDYVETHGPGTQLGDPIEAMALNAVYGQRPLEQPLSIGSVKTNVGHLETAAGIAGFVKTALALYHGEIPASLNFETPNPHIPFEQWRLSVATSLQNWPERSEPHLAGVSSFGFSGTNVHAIVGEADAERPFLVPLEGQSSSQLRVQAAALLDELDGGASRERVRALCRRAAASLRGGRQRSFALGNSPAQLRRALADRVLDPQGKALLFTDEHKPIDVVFVLPGHAANPWGVGRELLRSEPAFRAALIAADAAIRDAGGQSVLAGLYEAEGRASLELTEHGQPAEFALQVALGSLWKAWGVVPSAVIGHSMGEVAAAHLAGILSLEDAAKVICSRSRLLGTIAGRGAVAVVGTTPEKARDAIAELSCAVSIAAHNSASSLVLSGDPVALETVVCRLEAQGVYVGRTEVKFAAHSHQIDPLLEPLENGLLGIRPRPGAVAMYSTVYAKALSGDEFGSSYWSQNLRQTVAFGPTVARLLESGRQVVFIELSPHPILQRAVADALTGRAEAAVNISSLRRDELERASLLGALGRLYESGYQLDWSALLDLPAQPEESASDVAPGAEPILLVASAESAEGLLAAARSLAAFVSSDAASTLSSRDIAFTAAVKRTQHRHRLSVVGSSKQELTRSLESLAEAEAVHGTSTGVAPRELASKIAFVFSGHGSQWVGMGRKLYACDEVFRQAIDDCALAFAPYVSWALVEQLHDDDSRLARGEHEVVQPTLFAFHTALFALWRSLGVTPDAVIGHSLGEVAAAHVAGILSLAEAARVICRRSALSISAGIDGAMLLTGLTFEEAQAEVRGLEDRISVAVSNAPQLTVLSGDATTIAKVAEQLAGRQIYCKPIKVAVAGHCPQMDGPAETLRHELADIKPRQAHLAMYSTSCAEPLADAPRDAEYWARNVRAPVLFKQAIERALSDGFTHFVELSPHPVLTPAIEQTAQAMGKDARVLASLRKRTDERTTLLEALGAMYCGGCAVSLAALYPVQGRVQSLPAYAWHKERHWLEPKRSRLSATTERLGARLELADQPGVSVHQTLIDLDDADYLRDHCVQEANVLPAAAMLAALWTAASGSDGSSDYVLRDARFERPIAFGEAHTQTLQVTRTTTEPQRASMRLSSRATPADTWLVNASCDTERALDAGSFAALSTDEVQARCSRVIEPVDAYDVLSAGGLRYGDRFRGIERLWLGSREALGFVKLAFAPDADAVPYALHPALLDGCFQVACAASLLTRNRRTVAIPAAVEQFRIFQSSSGPLWAHARLREQTQGSGDIIVDVDMYDSSKALVARAAGLRLAPVETLAIADEAWLHRVAWLPRARTSERQSVQWLVVSDRGGRSKALASRLAASGQTATWCEGAGAALRQLLSAADLSDLMGVIYLGALDAAPLDESQLTADRVDPAIELLEVMQVLSSLRGPKCQLVVITKNALAPSLDELPQIEQATVVGMLRSFANEAPELQCRQVDVGPEQFEAYLEQLVEELACTPLEPEVALRGSNRLVARLERVALDGLPPRKDALASAHFGFRHGRSGVTPNAIDVGEPGPDELRLEVEAAALNVADFPESSLRRSAAEQRDLGLECYATVSAAGSHSGFRIGERVVALLARGCLASSVVVASDSAVRCPPNLGGVDAAASVLSLASAWHCLVDVAKLSRGERVLIHAIQGGVGLAAVRVARWLGAHVLATANTEAGMALLRSEGIEQVFDVRSPDLEADLTAATQGEGVDVVLNSLGAAPVAVSVRCLAEDGRFVEVEQRLSYEERSLPPLAFSKHIAFHAVDILAWARRHPERWRAARDRTVELLSTEQLQPLPSRVFRADQAQQAFEFAARAEPSEKVVLDLRQRTELRVLDEGAKGIRASGVYLIAGGLGGLGLHLAGWLAERGALAVVFFGRRPPSDEARLTLQALEAKHSTRFHTLQCDVSDREQLQRGLSWTAQEVGVLRGVFQLAMSLDDGLVATQTRARVERVLAPKVAGAWQLHLLTRELPLDHFVMYSSVVSVLGLPAQTSYAAANAFLDALAHYRTALGLPALSVNWGPYAHVGGAATSELRGERLADRGLPSIDATRAEQVLEALLARQATQVMVAAFDAKRWILFSPGSARKLELLLDEGASSRPTKGIVARLDGKSADERRSIIEDVLLRQAGMVLRMQPTRIDRGSPLQALGLDSLISLELRNRLQAELGVPVSATALWTYPSIRALVGFFSSQFGAETADTISAPVVVTADSESELQSIEAALALLEGPGA